MKNFYELAQENNYSEVLPMFIAVNGESDFPELSEEDFNKACSMVMSAYQGATHTIAIADYTYALGSLLHEKNIDEISLEEVIEQAAILIFD